MKLPPREKIPEAYTAIIDDRIKMFDNYAEVLSSDRTKNYLIKWNDNTYYSNDNSSYWQGYPGINKLGFEYDDKQLNEKVLKEILSKHYRKSIKEVF